MSPAKKPRKALDNALAAELVYGDTDCKNEPPKPLAGTEDLEAGEKGEKEATVKQLAQTTPNQARGNLMSRLMETPEKEATVRITVDLPKSMHQKLSMLSARTGKKKAEIVRMLLDDVLNDNVLDEV